MSLLFQSLTTSRVDIEYQYFVAVMGIDKALEYPLLTAVGRALYADEMLFMDNRAAILEGTSSFHAPPAGAGKRMSC